MHLLHYFVKASFLITKKTLLGVVLKMRLKITSIGSHFIDLVVSCSAIRILARINQIENERLWRDSRY